MWNFLLMSILVISSQASDEGLIYSPVGKRDPFRASIPGGQGRDLAALTELERFAVEQFQLRGILKTSNRSSALFEDPEGKTHILTEGDSIGRERATISRILVNEVILTIRTMNYLGVENLYEKSMALPQK
jgi:Tfp pilus assembly protein PilP